ncbi:FecR family protein [Chitinophaga varians]|uniref:FecR family protein n=1 Tax=Chitinophaga varians TaxID=2202339 RepID=A0A847S5L1_9BACT|nr:FecR domain-containing protein [Chitinophaga varians]NLR68358.1 FecR family protein [Chitinophaga varians]
MLCNNDMEQERIWLLLGRKVSGEATMAELRELEELLVQYPEMRYQVSVLGNLPVPVAAPGWTEKTELALEKHMVRLGDDLAATELLAEGITRHRKSRAGVLVALSTLVVVLAGYCVFLLSSKTTHKVPAEIAEIQTRNGSRSRATLPDGTEVWLNGGSRITYQRDMNTQQKREVFLSGEAFFKVARDAENPFVVKTSRMAVNVLGTAFNIKAYPNEEQTETSLISGSVEVVPADDQQHRVQLQPNQKFIIRHTQDGNARPTLGYSMEQVKANGQDDLINETAWCDNVLVFDNENFGSVALKMERWFGVKVYLTDKKLKAYRFTGTFKNESLPQILEALKVTSSFRCEVKGNEVFINQ